MIFFQNPSNSVSELDGSSNSSVVIQFGGYISRGIKQMVCVGEFRVVVGSPMMTTCT